MFRRLGVLLLATVSGFAAGTLPASAPLPSGGYLKWQVDQAAVDADIEGWPLARLLGELSAQTGWRVFVEPGAEHRVSAKFQDAKPGEALRRLLGKLNFLVLPAKQGSPALLVFETAPNTATKLVQASRSKHPHEIPNELVLRLSPDASESIEDLAKRLGAKIVGRIDRLGAYRLRFEDEAKTDRARAELARSGVGEVDPNLSVPIPGAPSGLGGTGASSLNLRATFNPDGTQVVVGLIDTVVQTEGSVLKEFTLPSVSVAGESPASSSLPSHGTTMAETLLNAVAQAPGSANGTSVRILPIDVFGKGEATSTFEIASGIYSAINQGAQIVNLSLGGEAESPVIHDVIRAGHAQGVVFLGAAGNEPVATPTWPAAYPEVIAVTATDWNGDLAPYANRGAFVDAGAPGTHIIPFQGESYRVVGTSPATAFASGIAAAIAAETGASGPSLEAQVRQSLALEP